MTLLPQIESSGMMRMTGFFPSAPAQVKFELLYAPVDGQWKLFGMAVSLAQSGPVAPQPAPVAAPAAPAPAGPAPAKRPAKPKE